MSVRRLSIQRLTQQGFAGFGDVIETDGRSHYSINAGTAERYDDLAMVDVAAADGRPVVSICRAAPNALPVHLRLMERHPLSSQAFIPLSSVPFLVVVAPAGDKLDLEKVSVFRSNGRQGVNYRRCTWHHPLLALERVCDFLIVDRAGPGENCEEVSIADQNLVVVEP